MVTEGQAQHARWLGLAVVFIACLLYFLPISQRIIADNDEGYYVLAGKSLYAGSLPYRDFFFPQVPMTAVIYGLWAKIFGGGLSVQRVLCALLAAGNGAVVFAAVRRRVGVVSGALALAFFCSSAFVFLWFPITKTYALSSLFLMSGLALAVSGTLECRRVLIAGCLVGLSASTRLIFFGAVPLVYIAVLLRHESLSVRLRALIAATAGCALGVLPTAILAARAPSQFWFCNVTYHGLRSGGAALVEDWGQKWDVAKIVLGIGGDGSGLQLAILMGACVASIWGLWRTDRPYVVFSFAALGLFAASLLPSPTWDQYFSVVVPPAAIAAGVLFGRAGPVGRSIQLGLLSISFVAGGIRLNDAVVRSEKSRRPAGTDSVAALLDESTNEGDAVASPWPDYLVGCKRRIHPLALDQYARGEWPTLSADEKRRYHLSSDADFKAAVLAGEVRAVAIGLGGDLGLDAGLKSARWKSHRTAGAVVWRPRRGF